MRVRCSLQACSVANPTDTTLKPQSADTSGRRCGRGGHDQAAWGAGLPVWAGMERAQAGRGDASDC